MASAAAKKLRNHKAEGKVIKTQASSNVISQIAMQTLDPESSILLVGDGNFSFSVAFQPKVSHGVKITATTIHSAADLCQLHYQAKSNVDHLEKLGVEVLFHIDATSLEQSQQICGRKFTRIIFNFPHTGGKSNIKRNRKLLKEFFASAVKVLEPGGDVCVSLCRGQGGTPSDRPVREWPDSWQVVAMAAYSNLTLRQMWPFKEEDYDDYSSTGFRSMDRRFDTGQAFTYVFRVAPLPQSPPSAPMTSRLAPPTAQMSLRPGVIDVKGQKFMVNNIVAKQFGRHLHTARHHPVCLVSQALVTCVKHLLPSMETDVSFECESPLMSSPPDRDTSSLDYYKARPLSATGDKSSEESVIVDAIETLSCSCHHDDTSVTDASRDQSKCQCNEVGRGTEMTCNHDDITDPSLASTLLDQFDWTANVDEPRDRLLIRVGEVYRRLDYYDDLDPPVQYEMVVRLTGRTCDVIADSIDLADGVLRGLFHEDVVVQCLPADAVPPCYRPYLDVRDLRRVDVTFRSDNERLTVACNQVADTGGRAKPVAAAPGGMVTRTVGYLGRLAPSRVGEPLLVPAVLTLRPDLLALAKYDIPDAETLWAEDAAILDQFAGWSPEGGDHVFRPISLHSPLWRHDVSFWENPDVPFDSFRFMELIRLLAGDLIKKVIRMNVWRDPSTGRVSRCYRQVYQSCRMAISHALAHDYQTAIRLTLAAQLGVELR